MLRMDYNLIDRLIRSCGENKIACNSIIHASVGNFDHIENSKSGKDDSHDTLVMLFRKQIFNLAVFEINVFWAYLDKMSIASAT